jgi:hypothetical protein
LAHLDEALRFKSECPWIRFPMVSVEFFIDIILPGGPGSSVGIATDYGLDGPVGERFIAHVQTGPGAHPASCTIGTGSFPGVKRSGRGADHLPPSAEVENE